MKIMLIGDTHFTDKTPENRLDDYPNTLLEKFKWFLETAKKEECKAIIQNGDFFDSTKVSNQLISDIVMILKNNTIPLFCIYGQHDMRYHSTDWKNTPLNILKSAGLVTILDDNPVEIFDVNIYGCSFGKEIPNIKSKKRTNILVIHDMIISNEKLWEGQENYKWANKLLKDNNFDLISSGDNHKNFTESLNDKHLINPGSLGRSTKSQMDHEPKVYIYYSQEKKIKEIKIPVLDSDLIFNIKKIEKEEKENKELNIFIEGITEKFEDLKNLSFLNNLNAIIKANEIKNNKIWEFVNGKL